MRKQVRQQPAGVVVSVLFNPVPASQAVFGSCPVQLRQWVSRPEPDLMSEAVEQHCPALSVHAMSCLLNFAGLE